jgi:hypothetical protein
LRGGLQPKSFQITSSRLLEANIRRAELVNKQINAIVQRHYEYAREEAKKVDDYVAKLDVKGKEYAEVCFLNKFQVICLAPERKASPRRPYVR